MEETEHHIFENGGLMYVAFDNGRQLRIVVPYYPPRTPGNNNRNNELEHNMDPDLDAWGLERPGYEKSEIIVPYIHLWISEETSELLAEIAVGTYMFIGKRIIFFRAEPHIEQFIGYVGNAGTQWAIAFNKDYVFVFFEYKEVVVVSRKRLEKEIGFKITDEVTEEQFWDLTNKIQSLPYANVKQTKFHDAWDEEFQPFDQKYLRVLLQKIKRLPERRKEYSNTVLALGPKMPMNISREIASYSTGLHYNPLVTQNIISNNNNIPMMKWKTTANNMGPFPNNFHGTLPLRNNRTQRKCIKGKCTVMGGRRRTRRRT